MTKSKSLDISRGKRLHSVLKKLSKKSGGGVSDSALARNINVPVSTMFGWVRGASIRCDALEEIARQGGDINYILLGEPKEKPSTESSEPTLGAAANKRFSMLISLLTESHLDALQKPNLLPLWIEFLDGVRGTIQEKIRVG